MTYRLIFNLFGVLVAGIGGWAIYDLTIVIGFAEAINSDGFFLFLVLAGGLIIPLNELWNQPQPPEVDYVKSPVETREVWRPTPVDPFLN